MAMLLDICRAQSQKRMPLATVALGIASAAYKIPRQYRTFTHVFHKGLEPSER